ncbi:hypothetical protein BaRGS_00006924, partial [Batillaria attramentaria]
SLRPFPCSLTNKFTDNGQTTLTDTQEKNRRTNLRLETKPRFVFPDAPVTTPTTVNIPHTADGTVWLSGELIEGEVTSWG